MKRLNLLFALLLVTCLLVSDLFAAPLPPQLSLDKTGITISVTWTAVADAAGYRLYYAPYPYSGPSSIRSIDMGSQTQASFTLWEDAAYYLSVTAYDGAEESHHSNTELFLLSSYSAPSPGAPRLTLETDASDILASWSTVPGASNYRLYYAPYPFSDPKTIGSLNMGAKTELSTTLWQDAAYYVAVTAETPSGESGYSNVELFLLGAPVPEWLNLGTQEQDNDGDGYLQSLDDCDDSDRTIHPGAEEICGDEIDQNCDGVDSICSDNLDKDNDGYSESLGDCNDGDPTIHPWAEEICGDGIDQDCSGYDQLCPSDTDDDNDGYSVNQGDCHDADKTIFPGAAEVCGDGVDQDCNGSDLVCPVGDDSDKDGYTLSQGDCNDADQAVFPGAPEVCSDGIDQDCNGVDLICPGDVDADQDGYSVNQGDCNDADQTVSPGANDVCGDGIDQDCNGVDLICPGDVDVDNDGYSINQGDCNDADQTISPGAAEVCGDAIDQDCSGADLVCPVESDADGDGYLVSEGDCNDTNQTIHPNTWETCGDGIDQNCSGSDLSCPTGENSFEAELRTLINQYRGTNSLGSLSHNLGLQSIAFEHSDYMLQTGNFSHDGFSDIRFPKSITNGCNLLVENLAWNFQTAQAAFDGWRNSSGHNANMLNPDINFIGLSKSGAYITMLGCRMP